MGVYFMHKTHTPFRWLFVKSSHFLAILKKMLHKSRRRRFAAVGIFSMWFSRCILRCATQKKKDQHASAAALKSHAGRDASETLPRASLSAGSLLAPGALFPGHCARCFSPQVRGAF